MSDSTMVEIPSDKLREAVKLAYSMSAPQGLGFLHAREGELSDEDADEIINREISERFGKSRVAASMDYVHGRSCKFTVFRGGEHGNFDDRMRNGSARPQVLAYE